MGARSAGREVELLAQGTVHPNVLCRAPAQHVPECHLDDPELAELGTAEGGSCVLTGLGGQTEHLWKTRDGESVHVLWFHCDPHLRLLVQDNHTLLCEPHNSPTALVLELGVAHLDAHQVINLGLPLRSLSLGGHRSEVLEFEMSVQ